MRIISHRKSIITHQIHIRALPIRYEQLLPYRNVPQRVAEHRLLFLNNSVSLISLVHVLHLENYIRVEIVIQEVGKRKNDILMVGVCCAEVLVIQDKVSGHDRVVAAEELFSGHVCSFELLDVVIQELDCGSENFVRLEQAFSFLLVNEFLGDHD